MPDSRPLSSGAVAPPRRRAPLLAALAGSLLVLLGLAFLVTGTLLTLGLFLIPVLLVLLGVVLVWNRRRERLRAGWPPRKEREPTRGTPPP